MIIAAALERIITQSGNSSAVQFDDGGKIVHIYFTGNPQTQCLGEMNFSNEDLSQYLITLNMFHLRSLEQGVDIVAMGKQDQMDKLDRKRKHDGFVAESNSIDTLDQQIVNVNNGHLEVNSDVKEEQMSKGNGHAEQEDCPVCVW